MRKYIFSTITVLLCSFLNAQNIDDVLRYSLENTAGTARFQSMSGAFGALGGDLSALTINPAGSAVFSNSYTTFTATNFNTKNNTSYFNGLSETSLDDFNINQAGAVFVFNNANTSSPWKKLAVGVNYELTRSLDNEFLAAGTSNQGIDGYFLNYANGVAFGDLLIQPNENIEDAYLNIGRDLGYGPQQAFLGYFGGIIDPVDEADDNNIAYLPTGDYATVNQEFFQSTKGFNSKFIFNVASQYNENLYLGASLNFHAVTFEKFSQLNESGYDAASALQDVTFRNLLYTEGVGFSFNLGGIAKLNESLRVGASYQSPTWYEFEDEFTQEINSNLADSEIGFINFNNVSTLFPKYKIKTPGKINASAALVFGKQGLLSFDYSYQDMSKAELRPASDPNFSSENSFIAQTLKAVNSYRIGGEYKIENWSLRGGYRFEDSPYLDETTIGDLTGFSVGLGYNFGGTKLDFAFSQSERDQNHLLYETGLPTPATVSAKNTNFGVSLSFNL